MTKLLARVLLLMVIVMPAFVIDVSAGTEVMSKFILAVNEDFDPHEVAAEIDLRGASGDDDWNGSVEKTHSMINVLIINGKSNTCDVLNDVDGVKTCEADSVVSIHD